MAAQFTENPLAESQNFKIRVLKTLDTNQIQSQIEQLDGVRKITIKDFGK